MTAAADGVVGVTGATGLLGAAWLRRALQLRPQLKFIAFVRDAARFMAGLAPSERSRVEAVQLNLAADFDTRRGEAGAARVTGGWWHFAAATTLARGAAALAETEAVNVRGTQRLLRLIARADPRVPLVHFSTAFVAGRARGCILEEPPSAQDFRNPYEQSKAVAERLVLAHFAAGGAGVILRPSIVLSATDAGRPQLPDLCRRALWQAQRRGERELVLRLPTDAELDLVPCEWVLQAADTIVAARPAARIFHLTAARPTRMGDLLAAVAQVPPGLRVSFQPDMPVAGLPPISRYLDRLLEEVRDYFRTGQHFDRSHTEAALPAELRAPALSHDDLLPSPPTAAEDAALIS